MLMLMVRRPLSLYLLASSERWGNTMRQGPHLLKAHSVFDMSLACA